MAVMFFLGAKSPSIGYGASSVIMRLQDVAIYDILDVIWPQSGLSQSLCLFHDWVNKNIKQKHNSINYVVEFTTRDDIYHDIF